MNMISEGLITSIDPFYWFYVAGWIVLFTLSTLLQMKMVTKKDDDKKDEDETNDKDYEYESQPNTNDGYNSINND